MAKKETKLCDAYSTRRTSLPAFGGVQSIVISADKDFAGMQTDVRFGGRHGAPGLGCLLYPRRTLMGSLSVDRVFDRNYVAFQALVMLMPLALWLVCRCASGKIFLVAHADCYPTAQSPELRPHNWDISVEGKR